jgi:hypothetical protein
VRRSGRHRRPTGAPPPLPRSIQPTGVWWAAAAAVLVALARIAFGPARRSLGVAVTVWDDAVVRWLAALQVKPFGLSGSAGSTPLRIQVQGEAGTTRHVFGKLYAKSHLRADRSYKLVRALPYGRLEDEKPFNTVKRLVQQEDYALALMQRAGLPSPANLAHRDIKPSSPGRCRTHPARSASSAGARGGSRCSCWSGWR